MGRAVGTFKGVLKKLKKGDIHTKLARLLFSYRKTPQSTTGVSPAELLMGRRLRSALDLVKPDLHKRMEREQDRQKAACEPHTVICSFKVGDLVYARSYRPGPMWEPGYVTEIVGPQGYRVRLLNEDQLWHRH